MKSGFGKLVLVVFIFGLGIGGAFGAGTAWGAVSAGSKPASTSAAAQLSQGDAAGATGGMSRPAATGAIEKIDGNILTVTTTQGTTKVNISKDSTIQVQRQGAVEDLKVGLRVIVTGEKKDDGSVNATSIQVAPDRGQGQGQMGQGQGGSGQRTRPGSNQSSQ